MAPSTWTALLILVVTVLPGAVYTYAFERQAGAFGATMADRILRFVAASAALDVVYAVPAYLLYRIGVGPPWQAAQVTAAWVGGVVALAVPAAVGSVLGGLYATRRTRDGWSLVRRFLSIEREARLLQVVLGRDPAPRAWDHVFSARPFVYLRVRCTDGRWLGGAFAAHSYAGGFPHDADLLLEQAWPVDESGVFGPEPADYAVYIPAAAIGYVEIVQPPGIEEA